MPGIPLDMRLFKIAGCQALSNADSISSLRAALVLAGCLCCSRFALKERRAASVPICFRKPNCDGWNQFFSRCRNLSRSTFSKPFPRMGSSVIGRWDLWLVLSGWLGFWIVSRVPCFHVVGKYDRTRQDWKRLASGAATLSRTHWTSAATILSCPGLLKGAMLEKAAISSLREILFVSDLRKRLFRKLLTLLRIALW